MDTSRRVYVYGNLIDNCWSVRQNGKVWRHCQKIVLRDCRLLVSRAGNERVRCEGVKNVHAGISGYISHPNEMRKIDKYVDCREVVYWPYQYRSFVDKTTRKPIKEAEFAILDYTFPTPVLVFTESKYQ